MSSQELTEFFIKEFSFMCYKEDHFIKSLTVFLEDGQELIITCEDV